MQDKGDWRWPPAFDVANNHEKGDILVTIRLEHPSVTFGALQKVRDLESQLLIAKSNLQSLRTVIQTLRLCGRALLRDSHRRTGNVSPCVDEDDIALLEDPQIRSLEVLRLKTEGHLESLEAIQRRVDVLVGLVSVDQETRAQCARIPLTKGANVVGHKIAF